MPAATEQLHLVPFHPRFATQIVDWVRDDQQLRWLAPSTEPPMTVRKLLDWCGPGGRAYAYIGEPDGATRSAMGHARGAAQTPLVGYAELNRMQSQPNVWWIGHCVVNPRCRGMGIGRSMVVALVAEASQRLAARSVCLVVFPDNLAAIRCYSAAGFTCIGEEFHDFGRPPVRQRLLRYELDRQAAELLTRGHPGM